MLGAVIRAYKSKEIPSNLFRVPSTVLRYCGIELINDETFYYKLYAYLWFFMFGFFYTFLQLFELYAARNDDIDKFASIVMFALPHVGGSIKCCMLFFTRHKFKRIIKTFHEGYFKPDINRGGETEFVHVRECLKKNETMFIILVSCVFAVYITSITDTIQMMIFKPRDEWEMTTTPITIVNTTYYPMFEIGIIFQNLCVLGGGTLILITDILLVSVISNLSCQFRILKQAFKNTRIRAVALKESEEGIDMSFELCFEIVIHDLVKHHLLVLDLGDEMENLCNVMLLFVFFVHATQLCFMLFYASLMPVKSILFVKSMNYYLTVLFELFIYCYFGDEVTTESVNLIDAVMEMDWPGAPISVQKSMVLVMGRSIRPVHITAGKIINVSIDTFMRIVKSSASYFMVLRQLNEEE